MELLFSVFEVITPWHWLGLALLLIGLEMLLGTYDLLWISGAAFLTAIYAFFAPAYAVLGLPADTWQAHLVVFTISGVTLVVMGRTVFSGLRTEKTDRPNLNNPGKALIGKRALAVADFVGSSGRVKLGDTTWSAISYDGSRIAAGTEVMVMDIDGTVLKVAA